MEALALEPASLARPCKAPLACNKQNPLDQLEEPSRRVSKAALLAGSRGKGEHGNG